MTTVSTTFWSSQSARALCLTQLRQLPTFIALVATAGCSALNVTDPTKLREENLNNAVGATLAVSGVRYRVMGALQQAILTTGSLTDEFGYGNGTGGGEISQRIATQYLVDIRGDAGLHQAWQWAYRDATIGLDQVRRSAPANIKGARLGEIYALRGYVMLGLAEQICPGFPVINLTIDGETIVPRYTSDPQTPDSGFVRALADFDSALAFGGDSARIRQLAQVGRGRALLGLGQFDAAETVVTDVETAYTDTLTSNYSLYFGFNESYYVQNREGTNGLDFVAAEDPRVVVIDRYGNVGTNYNYTFANYFTQGYFPPIVFSSGIEARLIQAEAALHEHPDDGAWLDTLNALRRTVALSDTTDPGTTQGRVDLLFRERAFWLFATAHRLGDMRRLIARYGRDSETVFPSGPFNETLTYGTLTTIPFNGDLEHRYNPKITGCTSM